MKKLYSFFSYVMGALLFTLNFAQPQDPMFQRLVTKPDPEQYSLYASKSMPLQSPSESEQQQTYQRPWYQQSLRTNIQNARTSIDTYKSQMAQSREQLRQQGIALRTALQQKGKAVINDLLDKTPEELAEFAGYIRLQIDDIISRAAQQYKPQPSQLLRPVLATQPAITLYTIAQIPSITSPAQIKEQLIAVSRTLETKKLPEKEMDRLEVKKDALQFLIDPVKRALYDVSLIQK